MFDVVPSAATILIYINTRHPACKGLFELLEEGGTDGDSFELRALKLLLESWARMEDEAGTEEARERYSDIRTEWGKIARDFYRSIE